MFDREPRLALQSPKGSTKERNRYVEAALFIDWGLTETAIGYIENCSQQAILYYVMFVAIASGIGHQAEGTTLTKPTRLHIPPIDTFMPFAGSPCCGPTNIDIAEARFRYESQTGHAGSMEKIISKAKLPKSPGSGLVVTVSAIS